MSTKALVSLVVLIVVVVGGWYGYSHLMGNTQQNAQQQATGQYQQQQQQQQQGSQQPSAPGDSSDAALNADLGNVDAQMQAANDATAGASSFNDTPVQQTE